MSQGPRAMLRLPCPHSTPRLSPLLLLGVTGGTSTPLENLMGREVVYGEASTRNAQPPLAKRLQSLSWLWS